IASAVALDGRLTDLQRALLEAVIGSMTGYAADLRDTTPMTADEFAAALSRRDHQFRSRIVQVMLLAALVLRPLPEQVVDQVAARWRALEDLPEGTLGRLVSQLYRARGFEYPGAPGSAPPLLAQHDWVHVLADFGTTVESEVEVFGFIARANDDMRAFSLLAM